MLHFVSEPLNREVAVLLRQDDDVLVIVNSNITDGQVRCEVVGRLLARAGVAPLAA